MFVMFATVESRPCCFGYFAVAGGGQAVLASRGQRPVLVRPVPAKRALARRARAKLGGRAATARRSRQRPVAGHQTELDQARQWHLATPGGRRRRERRGRARHERERTASARPPRVALRRAGLRRVAMRRVALSRAALSRIAPSPPALSRPAPRPGLRSGWRLMQRRSASRSRHSERRLLSRPLSATASRGTQLRGRTA